MTARILDGKAASAAVKADLTERCARLAERGVVPGLATILVGDDPASHVYVRNKRQACEKAGMRSIHHELAAETSQDEVAALIRDLNADPEVTGILLQLPVPPQVDGDEMTALIEPLKDVDGLTPISAGLLSQGREALVACTPSGVMELLRDAGVELKGAEAVVVG
ncbi:MAG: bifunctional 5,10-methylenetetrahydrofolate dehydrogenase/5,10-methenyltetrahydrofolate cyclohydrolase, partial [Acidimicrobiia bacterium]